MAKQNVLTTELNSPSILSPELIVYYSSQITKSRLRILEALAENGSLQQKDLCDVLDISKNNLSNMLSKLDQLQPKLLNITISGRNRIYTLTAEAKAYLDQLNNNSGANIRTFTDVNGPDYQCRQAIESFEKLKKISAPKWEIEFNNWLNPNMDSNNQTDISKQLEASYIEFMELMISLTLAGQPNILNRVYRVIGNNILEDLINKKIKEMLGPNHYLLLPLYQLEKQDAKHAQELIDEIISDLYPSIMQKTSQTQRGITDPQYYSLFYAVTQMRNDFMKSGTKEKALESWNNKYVCESRIPGYLANIFDLVSRIPRQSNL